MRWFCRVACLSGGLLLILAMPSAAGQECFALGVSRSAAMAGPQPAPAEPEPSSPDEPGPSPTPGGPGPSPTPADVPPSPNQSAVDDYVETFASSGSFDSGPTGTSYAADVTGPATLQSSEALAVIEYVYQHRLTDPDDTVQALMARDSEVSQAYAGLVSTGQLATSADTDSAAALHHLSLVRGAGTTGGFSVVGSQVISIGVRPPAFPPSCFVNLGGFIQWPNGKPLSSCGPNPQEAFVTLSVRQSNGQVYRAYTTSYACGPSNRSSYGFRNVPAGNAEVIARPVRLCCMSGQVTFNITCPPGPSILMPCIPAQTNRLASTLTMGPWTPPGYFGTTAPGARVWIADRESACLENGSRVADAQGNFSISSCLPSGDIYLYAELGNQIGRVNVADALPCGTAAGPYNIALGNWPRVVGQILNWQPSWYPKAGALARGCFTAICNAGAALTVTAPANQITGSYQLQVKPGRWTISSYYERLCANSQGQIVPYRCERPQADVELEAGQVLTLNLQPAPTNCPCP